MKKYKDMSMKEINEILDCGGDDCRRLAQEVRAHLETLELSQRARDMIATSDQRGIVEGFGGLFTEKEVEQFVAEMLGEEEEDSMTLEMILRSGKIENEEQANIFADNADFYDSENGNGDFRIETENGYAEIYGHREKSGEDEEMPVADPVQAIRYFDKDMNQIENPFE